jgi:predicted dehydrogenase
MRIGIVGLAGIGRHHLGVMNAMEQYEVVALCDVREDILRERAEGLSVGCYTDAAEMMDRERLDAVSLCTPPKVHLPHTRLAAERGIHVLAEKPMAPDVAQCQAMIDVCAEHNVVLMVAQKKRYVGAYTRLRELAEGPLGRIEVAMHRYPHPWMPETEWFWAEDDGGGPLVENAVHAADLLRFLLGDAERVYAEGDIFHAEHHAPQLNVALYTLRMKSGAIAQVGAGMVAFPAPGMVFEDLWVACENGIAEVSGDFDNPTKLRWALRSAQNEVHEESFAGEDPFIAEFAHFEECVRTGATPITSGPECLKSVALCLAVKQSARSREAVVL